MLSNDENILGVVNKDGLSSARAEELLEKNGFNVLEVHREKTIFSRIIAQSLSPMSLILIIAALFTFLIGEYIDGTIITITFVINVVIAIFQEGKASKAFEALNSTQARVADVVRDSKHKIISADELVVGDIVYLKNGINVPADILLLESEDLLVNESVLTGEWMPVKKSIKKEQQVLYSGTLIVNGSGYGVVKATGVHTQIADIGLELTKTKEITPLQKNISKLARFITGMVVIILIFVIILGVAVGRELYDVVFTAIAIAIAAIPSGLPAVVTVVLALGMNQILKKGGLIRNLLAAETLGATTLIITDKTGTLTTGKMTTKSIILPNGEEKSIINKKNDKTIDDYIRFIFMSTNGLLFDNESDNNSRHGGSPVEQSIAEVAFKYGYSRNKNKRLNYLPFSSERRFSAALLNEKIKNENIISITGAPETLIDNANYYVIEGKTHKMTSKSRLQMHEAVSRVALEGKRILGLAQNFTKKDSFKDIGDADAVLKNSSILCFFIFEDPVRADVRSSIKFIHNAKVEVLVATGDNPNTALSIAHQAGIIKSKNVEYAEGSDVDKLSDIEVLALARKVKIFARMLPNQKLRLLQILQKDGEIVGMTGDGVNDAPSLRHASIGIALGSGTEIAKEASDLILVKNSFSTITFAIIEGRKIITNLKKIIIFLLSTSFSELFLIVGALFLGLPLPLYPAQILWANIVGEGFIGFAFAFEKNENGIEKLNPHRKENRQILTPAVYKAIFSMAIASGIFFLILFLLLTHFSNLPEEQIRTVIFIIISMDTIFYSISLKNLHAPIWKINPFDNAYLTFTIIISLLLLSLTIFIPFLRETVFNMGYPPSWILYGVAIAGVFHIFVIEMVKKIAFQRRINYV